MFNLSIVTPEKIFYENEVASMIAPGIEGYLGILTNHAPLITAVIPGKVTVKGASDEIIEMSVSEGFLEVSANTATLLVDAVEYSSEIDADRAKEAMKRAKKRLIDEAGSIDTPRARKAVERAKSRIRIVSDN
ncbi:MAG: ATP synthase F1 subunit epsilon [candidate division Zixibacteria bacterium]|nr:ATP synthase F1 subunit epsilon [candidate division Zixibacteria bacterium]